MHGIRTIHKLEEAELAAYGRRMDARIAGIKKIRAARKKVITCVILFLYVAVYAIAMI